MPKVLPGYKQLVKEKIVKEAIKVFSELGYHRTKMTDIAKAVQVSKATLYTYFNSKEEIFLQAVEFLIINRQEGLLALIDEDNLMDIASENFFDNLVNIYKGSSALNYEIIYESARNKELHNKIIEAYNKRFDDLENYFNRLTEKGKIKEKDELLGIKISAIRSGLYSMLQYGLEMDKARKVWSDIIGSIIQSAIT
ncbi:MAG: TetR/AcrR family transcriptional regulator [Candidatus Heimdallarchaeota archaeon]|nr:TetR/AcrR family transcriptional regulator [Candidatus Heimdallarchaeota archaeon]